MNEALHEALSPIVQFLDSLDAADPQAASKLAEQFPLDSAPMMELAQIFERGVGEGWLCDRSGGPHVSYSRVSKSMGQSALSVDAVRMDGPGPGHSHPNGEFDLCFAVEGEPRFDDRPPGWTVYPPGSWHEPTVAGGRMNILYFLPEGAIAFGPKSS